MTGLPIFRYLLTFSARLPQQTIYEAKENLQMLNDSNDVTAKLRNLSWYLEINRSRFVSVDDAFIAGYKKALEDVVELIGEIKQNQNQCYN